MQVLITGANGFVGRALCAELLRCGHAVKGALRQNAGRSSLMEGVDAVVVGAINADTDWKAALATCNVVVHLAARVHVMDDTACDPLAEFRSTNTVATLSLAPVSYTHLTLPTKA